MNAFSLLRTTEYIGAKELRLNLDKILREATHPYRVMLHNKPTVTIIPDDEFLRLLELLEEIKDSGLLKKAAKKLKKETKRSHFWFWAPVWQEGEREADRDIKAGRVKRAGSAKEFFKKIKSDH